MALTGLGFAGLTAFWPLMIVAVAGTLNPSSGDVSVFLPTEQAALAHTVAGPARTKAFAWYNVVGSLAGGGGRAGQRPARLDRVARGVALLRAERGVFVFYAACAVAGRSSTRGCHPRWRSIPTSAPGRRWPSRGRSCCGCRRCSASTRSAAASSCSRCWCCGCHRRFDLDARTTAGVFFVAGALAAFSQVLSPWVAARIGLIRTMVYTHLPANLFLIAAGVMPTAPLAIACLLLRMAVSSMDVPARQAFVMAVVPPEERTAASTVTNVPRSLAAGLAPLIAGALLQKTSFGWPLIIGGTLKAIYDLALLVQFRAVVPREDGIR